VVSEAGAWYTMVSFWTGGATVMSGGGGGTGEMAWRLEGSCVVRLVVWRVGELCAGAGV